VLESGDGYAIEISAPGMSRADFKISAEEGRLTITGNRVQPNEDVGKYIRQEFGFSQEFSRSWSLPAGVDAGSIAARYESGILRVTVPVDRKRRRVEVRID
jgi:HSP20 family protein